MSDCFRNRTVGPGVARETVHTFSCPSSPEFSSHRCANQTLTRGRGEEFPLIQNNNHNKNPSEQLEDIFPFAQLKLGYRSLSRFCPRLQVLVQLWIFQRGRRGRSFLRLAALGPNPLQCLDSDCKKNVPPVWIRESWSFHHFWVVFFKMWYLDEWGEEEKMSAYCWLRPSLGVPLPKMKGPETKKTTSVLI